MSKKIENSILQPEQEEIYKTVDTVNIQLSTLETFIARRFDEISMEINATAQQADMAEDGITQRFSEILELLGAINYKGSGTSAANTGVELEAVIEDTENAANHILDAADRIVEYVSDKKDWNDEKVRDDIRERIKNDIQEILMACTFQDLTGQRIRNTLNNLHDIEARLSSTFRRLGIEVEPNKDAIEGKIHKAANQDEVDAMFSGSGDSSPSSQDDIDSMFD
ncbi:MAG: hypothetical protein COB14_06555 [Alphaproteobacteria bacterium]|nr:MAG: hypothetical protein COB14_06555 [Alphaproteobacteria bacterium]